MLRNEKNVAIQDTNTKEYEEKESAFIDAVKEERNKIINNAEREAWQIIEQARTEAEEMKSAAEAEVQQKRESLCEEEEKMRARMREYWKNQQKQDREKMNAKMARLSEDYLKETKRMEQIHDQMCDDTNILQVSWKLAMDSVISTIQETKTDFYSYLQKWKTSLYPGEVERLARCYVDLYRIINVNVDRVLGEELLGENFSEKTLNGLQKLKNTLSFFLNQYQMALHGLDLYVYSPKEGELFDDYFHVLAENIDGTEKRIVECTTPGIMKKAQNENDDDVVIRAVVRVSGVDKREDKG